MSFYTDKFGSYKDYLDWNTVSGERDYIIKLINNDLTPVQAYYLGQETEEIVLNNPSGIENFGLKLNRDEDYHGIFETTSLPLAFSLKIDGGGQFIRNAYDRKGIKSNVSAEVYKKNKSTHDFDLIYDYKIDFNSYKYESNDNGNAISVMLNQTGSVKKFTSRDEIEIDVTKNISIGGETITDIATEDITYKGIDVYLNAKWRGSYFNFNIELLPSESEIINAETNPTYLDIISNQLGDRVDIEDLPGGILYLNDVTDDQKIRYVRTIVNMPYTWTIEKGEFSSACYIYVKLVIYNSSHTIQSSATLLTITANTPLQQIETGSGNINYDSVSYLQVPKNGGYIKLYAEVPTHSLNIDPTIFRFNTNNGNGTYIKLSEKSPSIGDSIVQSYRSYNLAHKMMRLICDKNFCFITGYMAGMDLKNTFFSSGWWIRGYEKGFNINFKDFFKSLSYSESVGLAYYAPDDRFYIRHLDYFYKDELGIDFRLVNNFLAEPDGYYSSIKAGCDQSGSYENEQGALEFNLRYNFTTDFEVTESKNMLISVHTDSLAFEFTRRKQKALFEAEDTQYDKDIFMVYTDGTTTQLSNLIGIDGVESFYNGRYMPYFNLVRNGGILAGILWKDYNGFRYVSNTKDVDVSNIIDSITYNNKADITKTNLGTPYFYPEKISFDTIVTAAQIAAIRLDPYKYHKCTNTEGIDYYFYIDEIDINDSENKLRIVGKRANINR